MLPALKIISGGQTGADRAALDWAIARGVPHGGWCPRGRWAEDGVLGAQYQLRETPSADPAQRTEWNVRDAEATVIFSIRETLAGGARLTAELAGQYHKPLLRLARESSQADPAARLRDFLRAHPIRVLNVAGPRASEEPEVGQFVRETLERALAEQR